MCGERQDLGVRRLTPQLGQNVQASHDRQVHVENQHLRMESGAEFQCFESVFFANVVTGGEGVRGVETNTEREFRTDANDLLKMLETMADAVALPGGIFQKNAKLAKPQTLTRDLQTRCTQSNSVRLTSTTRTARMHDEIIDSQ